MYYAWAWYMALIVVWIFRGITYYCNILEIYKVVYRSHFIESCWHNSYSWNKLECVWLRSIIHLIRGKYGVKYDNLPIILYGDNASCIAHLNEEFIKEIEQSKLHQSFSTYISYKIMEISTCNRFVQVKI